MSGSTRAVTTTGRHRTGVVRRNAGVLAIAAVLAVIAAATTATWIGQQTTLESQETRIGALEGELRSAELALAERVATDVAQSLGISQSRLASDSLTLSGLVDTVFTWDSGIAYEQARTRLKDRYGLAEEDVFLSSFMPPSRYNEDDTGKRYYYIDAAHLNSAVDGDPDIAIIDVVADRYDYVVLVDVVLTADASPQDDAASGKATEAHSVLIHATVDAEGGVSRLSGVTGHGPTRHSQ